MLEIMEDEGERWIEIIDDKLLNFLYNVRRYSGIYLERKRY